VSNAGYASGYLKGLGSGHLHRLIYVALHGLPPMGTVVRHACDERRCIWPDHLRIGTQRENLREMVARGRWAGPRNEDHQWAVLTDAQIADIRARVAAGATQKAVAMAFGVHCSHVSRIVNGKARNVKAHVTSQHPTWAHEHPEALA